MDPQRRHRQPILGRETNAFETLISELMSPDNADRSRAESFYNIYRTYQPDALALMLANLLHSPRLNLCTMSSVLLRKLLSSNPTVDNAGDGLSRLSAATKASLKPFLLAAVQRQDYPKSLSKKICDVISEVAISLIPENEWPELLSFIFQVFHSFSAQLQKSSLIIVSRLLRDISASLLPNLASLHYFCLTSLSHPISYDVRIAALGASINLLHCMPSSVDRDRFQDLLPGMMFTLKESLFSENDYETQEALVLLIELSANEPKFFHSQLPEVVDSMVQIAETEILEERTRQLAIEFVITLAEGRDHCPDMMRNLPQFIARLFSVLMEMLLDISDQLAWHVAETDDDDAGEETGSYGFARECLGRISIALGANTIVPFAADLFPVYLSSPNWQNHHAALITLSQIAEGCSEMLINHLEELVPMVLYSIQSPHPRVRWAALTAIGQMSTCLGPDLHIQYHQMVLPSLALAMDDFQNPRVQAHAASALFSFTENCKPDILISYLDGIISRLLVLLQNEKQMLNEASLNVLASVADCSQEHLKHYYDIVMPYLKVLLIRAMDKNKRMLRAMSLKCISLVGMAVGKEKFKKDAEEVMEVLVLMQGTQMETDDPISGYMLQAWARICKCLGRDFLPYMNIAMPPLLQSAQLKPDVTVASTDLENLHDLDDNSIDTFTFGDKKIGISNSLLEEKTVACNLLCCYVDELKEAFFPWIDEVVSIMVPLLKFYLHEGVRTAAASAMYVLLRAAKLAIEKGLAQGHDETYVKQLSDCMIPALVAALDKEPKIHIISVMLDSLNRCIQLSGHLFDEGQVRSIVDEIKHVIIASASRMFEREKRTKAEDFDAEEVENLKAENELEVEIFRLVGDCLGTMIRTFKISFLPFLNDLSVYLIPMWGKNRCAKERSVSICIFNDVADHCKTSALTYYDTFLPFLLEASNDGNADVRQAALYGLGACAQYGGSIFRPLVSVALFRLTNVINHADAMESDNAIVYDNAVSALGKICHFHRISIDPSKILPVWLNCLPLRTDLKEAKIAHEQLCSLVEGCDEELFGPNNQNLPKILSVLVDVVCGGKDLATEDTSSRIAGVLKELQRSMPPSLFTSSLSSLQPHQQDLLHSLLHP